MPISTMTSSNWRRMAQYDSPVSRSISLTLPRFRTKTSRNLRLSGERRKKGESSNLPTTPVPQAVQLSWVTTRGDEQLDRKSTRLNSSHGYISYAVFCLKKKKKKINTKQHQT